MRLPKSERGFSLAEATVSIAIIGFFLMIAIPALANYYRTSRVRTSADLFGTDISKVRFAAVAAREPRALSLSGPLPATGYSYVTADGQPHQVVLPEGVRISGATGFPLNFSATGTLSGGPATLVIEGEVGSGRAHEYTLGVSPLGKVERAFRTYLLP